MTVNYVKLLVIELDPFCDSKVVYDVNCKSSEIEQRESKLRKDYPNENQFVIIALSQTMTLHNK